MIRVTLIGMGCGPRTVTAEGMKAIEEAGLIIGSKRMLALLPDTVDGERVCEHRSEAQSLIIFEASAEKIAVLYSGDTGLYSGAPALYDMLTLQGMEVVLIPGISVVSYFAARLGRAWSDWEIISCHGRGGDVFASWDKRRPLFILTSDGDEALLLCRRAAGLCCTVTIGERLGYDDEKISVYRGSAVPDRLNVLLVERL